MRHALYRLTRLLFILLLSCSLYAQEYSHARYDVKDGLAGSVVYHGVEDKDGFLWFATETGVSRFDGTHFKNFTKKDGLPDNEVLRLFVDSKGRVWMMPFRNAVCYYWKGKIYNQENDSMLKRLVITSRILDIMEDREGNLVLAASSNFHYINVRQESWEISIMDKILVTIGATGLNAAGNIICYATVGSGVFFWEINKQGKLLRNERFTDTASIVTQQSSYLSDRLRIHKVKDSLVLNTYSGKPLHTLALPHTFNNLSVSGDTLCAMNTGNGTLFYDIKTRKIIRQVLPGVVVNFTFPDSEGNWWFLTAGSGIYRVGSFEFNNYTFSENNKNYRSVFSIYKYDSLLYIGAENALLFTINTSDQTIRHQYVFAKPLKSRILSFAYLPDKGLYMGTDHGIVPLNNPAWEKKMFMSIKSLQTDGDSLLTAVEFGLVKSSKNGLHKDVFVHDVRTTCGYVQTQYYYAGTLNGLYTINRAGEAAWLGEQHPLLRGRITDIEEGHDGMLWIATHGEGVVGYKDNQVIYSIRQENGLTSDICRTLFINGHDVWVGTDKGLNRIQWQAGEYSITTFTRDDGLLADIINTVYVDGSQVYVGTPAGLTSFDANKISLNSYCKLRLTGIQAAGKIWQQDTTGFVLPPAENTIRFDYVGISYRSGGNITYRYRLMGLNDTWQNTSETFLNYLSLPSGNYELQLVASNKFGVESDMIRIPFRVEKQLWEKNWFRLLVLLLTGFIIWAFVSNRIRKIRRQNDEMMQINNRMAELEQMALKAQMNPHFIFNSLNSVQQYVIDKDLRGANKFITEFSRLIRLTLDISSSNKISIYEEISYLTTYLELEKTKYEDKFSYSVELAAELEPSEWFIPPMILQPYVENSIRHGVRYRHDKLGHIKLSFGIEDQYLVCQIEDNGVGRKKAAEYKSEMAIEYQSKGMTLTAKRIEMLNKHQSAPVLIVIEDLEKDHTPAGTRVIVRFPVQEASSS